MLLLKKILSGVSCFALCFFGDPDAIPSGDLSRLFQPSEEVREGDSGRLGEAFSICSQLACGLLACESGLLLCC
jgi:hypothetical protein